MGIATTEEDLELCKSYVAVAKALSPYNEAVSGACCVVGSTNTAFSLQNVILGT